MLAKQQMKNVITSAINKAIEKETLPQGEIPEFIIETPADKTNGDLATNAAMVSAKAFRMPPFKIAQAMTEKIELTDTLYE
ncbi:MAG: arginine--tRNA ligase, partial [Oscillospiraceae bacterium]|nr:arginine--tRNA ligase [Oscillospiraceae bacterium]